MSVFPTLMNPVPRGWRARALKEVCAECGALPGKSCRVTYGKGPSNAKPELLLSWGHLQKKVTHHP